MLTNLKKLHKTIVLSGTVLLFLSSCEVIQTVDDIVVANVTAGKNDDMFLIKKGNHYSNNSIRKMKTNAVRFEATFDSSAVYETAKPENQGDINKLYGMSDCDSKHHANSARFGWRWFNNQLEIHAYTYVNKQRSHRLIRTVQIDRPFAYELRLEDGQYVFTVNDTKVVMPRGCSGVGEGYLLYPYFGGDEAAPHDVKIKIKSLN